MSPTFAGSTEEWPEGAAIATDGHGYVEVCEPEDRPAFRATAVRYRSIGYPDSPYIVTGTRNAEDLTPLTPLAADLLHLAKTTPRKTEREFVSELLHGFFKGDDAKVRLWFKTRNPLLGGMKPDELMEWRPWKLHKIVVQELKENER